MSKLQAIVFDMDDTLYPERDYVMSGFQAVSEWISPKLAIDAHQGYLELQRLFMDGSRGNVFNLWLTHYDAPQTWVPQMVQVYRSHNPEIKPFPEVHSLLSRLSESFKIGLISDGYLNVQQKKLDALNIKSFFNIVTFTDQWGRAHWKPSPRSFIHTKALLGSECIVYVADNPLKDFYGARYCKWRTIWVRREKAEYTHFTPPNPEYSPDITIPSLAELENALNELE